MSELELELTRTLDAAADRAPRPGDDFLRAVRSRQRRRRQRRAGIAAACAVALAIVAGVGVTRLAGPPPPPPEEPPAAHTWSGTVPDLSHAEPPERVWPKATRRLPGTLPDGGQYKVRAILGKDRYLVDTTSWDMRGGIVSRGRPASSPSVFDVKAGTVRQLGDPDAATAKDVNFYHLGEIGVVRDEAVWLVSVTRGNKGYTEVWAAPLDGTAAARRLIALTDADNAIPHISFTDDGVLWRKDRANPWGPAGIHRLPISGGEPALVPGSEKFNRIDGLSPWLFTGPWSTPMPGDAPVRQGELWNLVTGQRITWTAKNGSTDVFCDPVLCMGVTAGKQQFVQRPDGTGYQAFPRRDGIPDGVDPALGGRFGLGLVQLAEGRNSFVWDRFTGKGAVVTTDLYSAESTKSAPTNPNGPTTGRSEAVRGMAWNSPDGGVVQWSDGNGGLYVLDLKAIR
jgi:hypothetical protein